MKKVYIAGPFFNPRQVATVEMVEAALEQRAHCLTYFSPMRMGILSPSKQDAKRIFDGNIKALKECDSMIAIIDDRDTGTIWEMGYAYATGIDTITFTNNDYGLNVMIGQSIRAHCVTESQLLLAIDDTNWRNVPVHPMF
jgi:nucleoside 2-deoxyribosyltransferase